jgi:hypothetical protein
MKTSNPTKRAWFLDILQNENERAVHETKNGLYLHALFGT